MATRGDDQHCTNAAYVRGCVCSDCREYQRKRMARNWNRGTTVVWAYWARDQPESWTAWSRHADRVASLELLEVLRISIPTPRGQEAQLDQVVEAHRIAREGRIDNASDKEEDDQDQFSSCVPTYFGLIR